MDYVSYFIEGKALFGGHPTQERVNQLEKVGVKWFVTLVHEHESGVVPFTTKYNKISFPIPDRYIPSNWIKYARFIIKIGDIISNLQPGELLSQTCRGGHGRSCTVVSSILCYLENITPQEALRKAAECHKKRPILRAYWRERGPPITHAQRNFVCKFFEPINFFRPYNNGYTAGFSTFTDHPVTTPLGTFPYAESAIQAYKNPTDEDYVKSQRKSTSPLMSKNLGRKVKLREDWYDVLEDLVYLVYKAKFDQHVELKKNLMNTGLRPIIYCTHIDKMLGNNGDNTGKNILGKTLVKLRDTYYREEDDSFEVDSSDSDETSNEL